MNNSNGKGNLKNALFADKTKMWIDGFYAGLGVKRRDDKIFLAERMVGRKLSKVAWDEFQRIDPRAADLNA